MKRPYPEKMKRPYKSDQDKAPEVLEAPPSPAPPSPPPSPAPPSPPPAPQRHQWQGCPQPPPFLQDCASLSTGSQDRVHHTAASERGTRHLIHFTTGVIFPAKITHNMTETSKDTPKSKETDKVIKQLSAKINKEPKNAGHFFKRAQQYSKKEDYEKCFNDAKHALDLDESLVEAAVLGGEAATKCGKFQGAHSIFSIGLKQDKKDENLIQGLKKLQRAIVNSYDTEDTTEQGYNAVDLCTQSPYPGDDQLLNLEKEILDRRHDIREVSRLPKKEIDQI
ncbi:unnamed protein product [Mytilus edulis]|uniref:Uncharacterized protein n=1 Tax=Mytilus edulis TaxID=6550 RepID=A0A8S3RNU2_MYTED|nr:unnamed protein product [Mytilus edulis]